MVCCATGLGFCHAVSGTDTAYQVSCGVCTLPAHGHRRMERYQHPPIVVLIRYAVPVLTEPIVLTEAILLPLHYAVPGTEIGYAGTRRQRSEGEGGGERGRG
eukprot:1606058-Rhodomonas_salina.1